MARRVLESRIGFPRHRPDARDAVRVNPDTAAPAQFEPPKRKKRRRAGAFPHLPRDAQRTQWHTR